MDEEYQALIEECKATITESVFTSRWALVEGYWTLGKLTREYLTKSAKGSGEMVARIANSLKLSERTVYYSLQAFDKFPDINLLPDGKNITWHKLTTKYLPDPLKKKDKPKPPHVYLHAECNKYVVEYTEDQICTCGDSFHLVNLGTA